MTERTLTLTHLTVRRNDRAIVSDASLSIEAGEFITIVGRNGAGKSTILRAISGLLSYEGSIKVRGGEIRSLRKRELAQRVSFLPQRMEMIYPIPVREFVLMGRYPHLTPLGGYQRSEYEIVDSMFERLCLEEVKGANLNELSGGEQQRVFLASALVQGASFLVLDEPTSSLDPVQQEVLYESLRDVQRKEGVSIIAASHHLNLSVRYSSRIVAIASGAICYDGDPVGFQLPAVVTETYQKAITI